MFSRLFKQPPYRPYLHDALNELKAKLNQKKVKAYKSENCIFSIQDIYSVIQQATSSRNKANACLDGRTALMHAISFDCAEAILDAILAKGAAINATVKIGSDDQTALIMAVEKNNLALVEWCLRNKAFVDITTLKNLKKSACSQIVFDTLLAASVKTTADCLSLMQGLKNIDGGILLY